MKKTLITILLTAVVCFAVVGTTVAFLIDKTDPIVNTFTVGTVDIKLTESTGNEYKLIPGHTYDKDPTVTVKANSEACWLFVEVKPENGLKTYVDYAIADGWIELPDNDNVYYREVPLSGTDQPFAVLLNNKVTVKSNVTKAQLDALRDPLPTLTLTAYAVQMDGLTAAQAWAEARSAS
jgi:hypothetical protein